MAFVGQVDRTVQRELRLKKNERYIVSRNRMNVTPLEGFECIENSPIVLETTGNYC